MGKIVRQAIVGAGGLANRLLAPFGFRVSRWVPPTRNTLDIINGLLLGKHGPFVIDVGAAVGDLSAHILRIAPNAKILCIEPIARHEKTLRERFRDYDVAVVSAAAGDRDGEVVFHETNAPDSSSVLPVGRHRVEFPSKSVKAATYAVSLRRLDTILATDNEYQRPIDLLKIDAQGFELPILLGAERSLPRCRHILLEMSLRPLYEGQASFEDVVWFMHGHGFRMVDYAEGARSHVTRELLQMDFLYESSVEPVT